MLEDALAVARDPDYRFELAVRLGKLNIAEVNHVCYSQVSSFIMGADGSSMC